MRRCLALARAMGPEPGCGPDAGLMGGRYTFSKFAEGDGWMRRTRDMKLKIKKKARDQHQRFEGKRHQESQRVSRRERRKR
jgi:hypothetical protein